MPHKITGVHVLRRSLLPLLSLLLMAAVAGCASAPPAPAFVPPVFPAPPDPARFIFERSLSFSDNVETTTRGDRFRMFALGEQKTVRGLIKPFGVAAYRGQVYVTDTAQRLVVEFDIARGRYREIGTDNPGQLTKPMGIDVSSLGEVFVSDMTLRQIFVYTTEGKFLRAFGNKTLFNRPSGIAVSPDGTRAYVVDTGGVESDAHQVLVFDAQSGEHLQTIGKRGIKDGEFNMPLQAAVGPDGTLYVVDKGNFRVQAFNRDGSFARAFGSAGRFPGQFASPKGIATDAQGNVYVVDTAFGNFQIFNSQGQLLMFIGERGAGGAPAKYMLPAGIDVDEDGRVYMVDQFFRKVDVFRPIALQAHEGYAGTAKPLPRQD